MAKPYPGTVLDRFYAHVEKADNGCWNWTAALRKSYGAFKVGSRSDGTRKDVYAHRFIWEELVGPIPGHLQIDHLCRNPRCVNPHHLELVTPRTNTLRGKTITAVFAAQTHCKAGHEFTPENTYIYKRSRLCRECQRERGRRFDQTHPERARRKR